MNLILSTKIKRSLYRPLWVEVPITQSFISNIAHSVSTSCFGSSEHMLFHADGWWQPRQGFSDCKLQAVCKSNTVRFRLIDGGHQEPIVTSGINVKTLARLNETCGTTEKVFYSKDVPVLMAIYYSTKRYETFK